MVSGFDFLQYIEMEGVRCADLLVMKRRRTFLRDE